MRNADVVDAWVNGKVAAGGNLLTDGRKLYSYRLCIGHTEACELTGRPQKIVRDYTAKGDRGFVSMTTSQHVGLAKRFTMQSWYA